MILSAWFGYFEYVDYLPHGILLTVLKYCLSFIASCSTGLPNHGASSNKKSLTRNFTKCFGHVQSVTAPFLYIAKIFVFCLHFYLSWNNKAYYDKNVAFSHPSSILKWLYRNPPTLLIFLNACWHDSYHNII